MFELSGVNYEEVLEQGDSILVRVIASSNYRGFELSGLYCIYSSKKWPQLGNIQTEDCSYQKVVYSKNPNCYRVCY